MKKNYTLVIGADHRGFELKQFLMASQYAHATVAWVDVGAFSDVRSDYPAFAVAAVQVLLEKKADCGILLCATGVGMAVAANRFPGIYAGVAWNEEIAAHAKEDDNINMLVVPSDYVTHENALSIVNAWLVAEFKQGRYAERVALIDAITVK